MKIRREGHSGGSGPRQGFKFPKTEVERACWGGDSRKVSGEDGRLGVSQFSRPLNNSQGSRDGICFLQALTGRNTSLLPLFPVPHQLPRKPAPFPWRKGCLGPREGAMEGIGDMEGESGVRQVQVAQEEVSSAGHCQVGRAGRPSPEEAGTWGPTFLQSHWRWYKVK